MRDTYTNVGLRSSVLPLAREICQLVLDNPNDPYVQPCSMCMYRAASMHAEFVRSLPRSARTMPPELLCERILVAGLDA